MLNKILNNLKKPHLVPMKILQKIEHFCHKKNIIAKFMKKNKITSSQN